MKKESIAAASNRLLEQRLGKIKELVTGLGAMRPGSISQQYSKPRERKGGFYQLSYTLGMKSHTEYVRAEDVEALKRETQAYKRFRELTQEWVVIELELSRRRVNRAKRPDKTAHQSRQTAVSTNNKKGISA